MMKAGELYVTRKNFVAYLTPDGAPYIDIGRMTNATRNYITVYRQTPLVIVEHGAPEGLTGALHPCGRVVWFFPEDKLDEVDP